MVDFHSPSVIEEESRAYSPLVWGLDNPLNLTLAVAVVKFWHTLDGIFM